MGQDGLRQAMDFERECQDLFAGLAAKAGHPLLAKACAALAIPAIAHRVRLGKELAALETLKKAAGQPRGAPPSRPGHSAPPR